MTKPQDILSIVADGLRDQRDPHAILDDMWAVLDQLSAEDAEETLSVVLPQINALTNQIASETARLTGTSLETSAVEMEPDLFDAIEDGDLDRVAEGLKSWDVNRPFGKYEKTPLYAAMSNMFDASLATMTFLLDAGADPKRGLSDGNVLHGLGFANLDSISAEALAFVVRRCMALGADIEQRTPKLGWTPLHYAVSEWNPVATEALLLAGADANAPSGAASGCFSNARPLEMGQGKDEVVQLLRRFGAY